MSNKRVFFDTVYRFTDPVRVFKANDPYFYQVDNIPVKQLEENVKFLKAQIEGILGASGSELFEIDRVNFTELKPYIDGTDNIVKVKPGRYSARINDAYSITPLQILRQISGFNFFDSNFWESRTNIDADLLSILTKFQDSAFHLGMDGLAERAFTYPVKSTDLPSNIITNSSPTVTQISGRPDQTPAFPGVTGKLWLGQTSNSTRNLSIFNIAEPNIGFAPAAIAESEFIKRWRGIARTSIVNVEEELTIDIPAFDPNDFYYYDETGAKVLLTASHRIDLVFIYSKPIDVSSTTLSRFSADTPISITKPTLGIVKGAGIGVSLKRNGAPPQDTVSLVDSNGNPIILPNIGDEDGSNTGIGTIRGSFPSPDDLMNIAPLLSESLELDNYALIGQSILPVAYVVVRDTASTNSNGVPVIAVDDLIDIRPFFRTTELAYNERAGIAAATPQISLANPVASEGYVESQIRSVYDDYTSKFTITNNEVTRKSRIVGAGYIQGGYNFGVEGVLGKYIEARYNLSEKERQKQEIISRFGLPTGMTIPDYPDWDIAEWCVRNNMTGAGTYPADYINFHYQFGGNGLEFGAYADAALTSRLDRLASDSSNSSTEKKTYISFVKKKILLDKTRVSWLQDYFVTVQLWNCAPSIARANDGGSQSLQSIAGVWVDKRRDEFTIYVAWIADDPYNRADFLPYTLRDNPRHASIAVINNDIMSYDYSNKHVIGETTVGVAYYPSVTSQVHSIPVNANASFNGDSPVLVLA